MHTGHGTFALDELELELELALLFFSVLWNGVFALYELELELELEPALLLFTVSALGVARME